MERCVLSLLPGLHLASVTCSNQDGACKQGYTTHSHQNLSGMRVGVTAILYLCTVLSQEQHVVLPSTPSSLLASSSPPWG